MNIENSIQDILIAEHGASDGSDEISLFCKQLSIDFAKYICMSKITKVTTGIVGVNGEELDTQYWPQEFQLILGELQKRGNEVFDEFINNYNKQ